MSPAPRSRRLRNQQAPVTRTRRELTIAISGSVAVVGSTLLLIWAMRPGPQVSVNPLTGGLIHRQPRVSLFLAATAAAIALAAWALLRRDAKVRNRTRALAIAVVGVVAAAVIVFGVWHDSLLRNYAVPTFPTTTPTTAPRITTTVAPKSTTTAKTGTTVTTTGTATTATTQPPTSTTGG
jgi:hypothetical protein